MKFRFRYFIHFGFIFEVFLFAFNLFLAIGIAFKLTKVQSTQVLLAPVAGFSGWYFLVFFAIATLAILFILKYVKKTWVIQSLFYLAILEGLLIFGQAYFTYPASFYFVVFMVIVWLIYQNIFVHNIAIILAVSAISVIFGLSLSPSMAIIILLILAIYDFWAVYKTKHMVKMFKGLAEAKVHFSLIIPETFRGLFTKVKEVNLGSEYLFLGTGDLAIPAIFVISSLKISIVTAFYTSIGAILGLILLYTLFVIQEHRQPMPGLPPIIMGSLLGYLISFLI
ncbi:presenilin family intramembrane aspartyl protease [Patescibacteria group bacterium]